MAVAREHVVAKMTDEHYMNTWTRSGNSKFVKFHVVINPNGGYTQLTIGERTGAALTMIIADLSSQHRDNQEYFSTVRPGGISNYFTIQMRQRYPYKVRDATKRFCNEEHDTDLTYTDLMTHCREYGDQKARTVTRDLEQMHYEPKYTSPDHEKDIKIARLTKQVKRLKKQLEETRTELGETQPELERTKQTLMETLLDN